MSQRHGHLTEQVVEQERLQELLEQIRKERLLSESLKADNARLLYVLAENDKLIREKDELHAEMQGAASYIATLEDKTYQSNKVSLELLERVRDLESENETLKGYIIDLKSRIAIYIPVKSDVVDMKLAEYINNYPDR